MPIIDCALIKFSRENCVCLVSTFFWDTCSWQPLKMNLAKAREPRITRGALTAGPDTTEKVHVMAGF